EYGARSGPRTAFDEAGEVGRKGAKTHRPVEAGARRARPAKRKGNSDIHEFAPQGPLLLEGRTATTLANESLHTQTRHCPPARHTRNQRRGSASHERRKAQNESSRRRYARA